jgi:hypothetical protein
VRGKGKDNELMDEYSLQGFVEPNGLVHFEMQFQKSKDFIKVFSGQLNGHEITGTWTLDGFGLNHRPFKMARAKKTWKGTYKQGGKDHEMIIEHMNIFNDKIKGKGADEVGEFIVNGDSKYGKISFVKQYIGKHSVSYEGTTQDERRIEGKWSITSPTSNISDAFVLER